MEQSTASAGLAEALRQLYAAADRPTLHSMISAAKRQRPPVTLRPSALSAWLNGETVPADAEKFRTLVAYLESRAAARSGYGQRGARWWERLRQQAWAERHARRGVRPPTHPTLTTPPPGQAPLGRVIGDLDESDAITLEVHDAVNAHNHQALLPVLPPYLPRLHDQQLRHEVALAEEGNRIVVLVGGSSTGKTRACWEAIRSVLPHWRVWHPLTPDRPTAVVEALRSARIAPHTVVWLNNAQEYLLPDPAGAQVASALQELLHNPATGPILVLGSMWPMFWRQLTASDPESPHAAARALLGAARDIPVSPDFTSDQLRELDDTIRADPRLRLAVRHARGRITQFLAGGVELERRYHYAEEATKAVLWAAMDARRLGHGLWLPEAFLHHAAPGYLDPDVWEQTTGEWFSKALEELTRPCHGVPGPLSRRRSLPDMTDPEPLEYRLADYLDQLGRATRAHVYPPTRFWEAALAALTDSTDLTQLARAAQDRGRIHRADQLYGQAAERGDAVAFRHLAQLREKRGDGDGADQLYRQAAEHGDAVALRHLAELREGRGNREGAEAAAIQAANHGDTTVLRHLAELRKEQGDRDGADQLYRQAAERGDTTVLRHLAELRRERGNREGAEAAAIQAANHGDTTVLRNLARFREEQGDRGDAERLYHRAAERGDAVALRHLARLREGRGDREGAEAAAIQAADQGDTTVLRHLARLREERGDLDGAEQLCRQATDRGDTFALWALARLRNKRGDRDGANRLRRFGLNDDGTIADRW